MYVAVSYLAAHRDRQIPGTVIGSGKGRHRPVADLRRLDQRACERSFGSLARQTTTTAAPSAAGFAFVSPSVFGCE